ncbi:MAG: CCA tRNA nucleotidyltransferase [Erysipelotrichaceae bacterium]|nr:CCA tRNA nucleotidyltransferase [Erysipelotrichaceae bacterium]
MNIPEKVSYILQKLADAGFEGYIVGGCVRDSLLGLQPHDYDITTNATPEQMHEIFERYSDTGLQHGTVTVIVDHEGFEVTTYRTETVYSDHRHPDEVSFSRNISDDLSRRDFTINAMAYNGKDLVDLFGGQQDLQDGIIRTVGDPRERFGEDALRILRAIRFASRFGFAIEEKTREAMFERKEDLRYVSQERILKEMNEILCSEYIEPYLLEYEEIFEIFLPELAMMQDVPQHHKYHLYDLWHHTVKVVAGSPAKPYVRWAALFHDIGKAVVRTTDENGKDHFYGHAVVSAEIAEKIFERLRMDNRTSKAALLLIENHDQLPKARRLLSRMGEYALDLIVLKKADCLAQNTEYSHPEECDKLAEEVEKLIAENAAVRIADLQINGNDLLALGYQGREIGDKLEEIMERVLEGYPNEREELLKLAERR